MNFAASCRSPNIISLTTYRKYGQQYVGESGQPLQFGVNGHHFNIAHRRTEESPVAEHFDGDGHTLADATVMVIDKYT